MRCSVVIPTYQRRGLVSRAVRALERQQHRDFGVIVVVDGSRDGTADELRKLSVSFPLTVLEQPNQGAATARNAGAAASDGDIVVFLDDDMEADPSMLAEHVRSHRAGADLVVGHVPLHRDSPDTAVAAATGRWAERRRRRLEASAADVPVSDLLTGQMSIARAAFEQLGGFDPSFTRGGLFGGEDLDLGQRAVAAGLRIVFNPEAVSHQYYDIDAATYTRRTRDVARSDQELSARYPALAAELSRRRRFGTRWEAAIFGSLARAPDPVRWPVRSLAVHLHSRPSPGRLSNRLFFAVQTMEHEHAARAARTQRSSRAVVLAYHSISDLGGDPVLHDYGMLPGMFAAQLDALSRRGWRFISFDDLARALAGNGSLPRRAALVTFDDGYRDLLTSAAPVLSARGIPSLAFVVSDRIGGVNDWERPGTRTLELLDEDELRSLADHGVTIGSHSATHRSLVKLDSAELERELTGSAERLRTFDRAAPRVFSYPYGDWNATVAAAVRAAGYDVAFTVDPGAAGRGQNPVALPRVEVSARDTPRTLRMKARSAAWPAPIRRRLFKYLPRPGE